MERLAIFVPMKALEEAFINRSDLRYQESDENGYYLWAKRQHPFDTTLLISGDTVGWLISADAVAVIGPCD